MSTAFIRACWMIVWFAVGAGGEPEGIDAVNYGRPFEPPMRRVFISLPPGAVEPTGWLRDWCLTAKHGYTGHMDDVDPAFQHGWAADSSLAAYADIANHELNEWHEYGVAAHAALRGSMYRPRHFTFPFVQFVLFVVTKDPPRIARQSQSFMRLGISRRVLRV